MSFFSRLFGGKGELERIIDEINQMQVAAHEYQRRIALCRRGLALTDRHNSELWAFFQEHLGNALYNTPEGDRQANLEAALLAYTEALAATDRHASPVDWGIAAMNLANVYRDRLIPDRGEGLEHSLTLYQEALAALPAGATAQWAMVQSNMGVAYRRRAAGSPAANVEAALEAFQHSAEGFQNTGQTWYLPMVLMNLGNAYATRLNGTPTDNGERAIEAYEAAIPLLPRAERPIEYGRCLVNLGNAYLKRTRGDPADNLERAIACHEEALTLLPAERAPADRGLLLANLGRAYGERVRDDGHNLANAAGHLDEARNLLQSQGMDREWAAASENLATIRKRQGQFEQAEELYNAALAARSAPDLSIDRAQTLHNLGILYLERSDGDAGAQRERALTLFAEALKRLPRELQPTLWASTTATYANAYAARLHGERQANVARAVELYHQALAVQRRETLPEEYRQTQRNLAHLLFAEGRWGEALAAYENVIALTQERLLEAFTDYGRRAELAETSFVYTQAAYCLLRLGRLEVALERLEAGKTRLLAEALTLSGSGLKALPSQLAAAVVEVQQQLRELDHEYRLPPGAPARRSNELLAAALEAGYVRRRQLLAQARAVRPDLLLAELSVGQIMAVAPEAGALVASVITTSGTAVIVVPAGAASLAAEHVIWLDALTLEELLGRLVGASGEGSWFIEHHSRPTVTAASVERTTAWLWEALAGPLLARLQQLGLARAVLLPQGGLQLLPLHAAWRHVEGKRRYLLDDLEIAYAPSAYALYMLRGRERALEVGNGLVVGVEQYRSLPPLSFVRQEIEQVRRWIGGTVLLNEAAGVEAVLRLAPAASVLHLACHGSFAWKGDPLASALHLADGTSLNLGDILGRLQLPSTRLVVLSACETGVVELVRSPDEFVGLASGLIQAGAATVVSSLWAVNDQSTALLMEHFYQQVAAGLAPREALAAAQHWLRHLPAEAVSAALLAAPRGQSDGFTAALEELLGAAAAAPAPYASPYYWAAFICYG